MHLNLARLKPGDDERTEISKKSSWILRHGAKKVGELGRVTVELCMFFPFFRDLGLRDWVTFILCI